MLMGFAFYPYEEPFDNLRVNQGCMPQYSGSKVKTPLNPFLQFGPSFWLRCLTEGGKWVFYMAYTLFSLTTTLNFHHRIPVFSMTMLLGTPFLANVHNICLTVIAFLSLTFITFAQPEKASTKIKNKPMSQICARFIWTLDHAAPSLGHLCILAGLYVLIFIHLGHLICSLTSLQYLGHQACNLNLFLHHSDSAMDIVMHPFNYILP